jgi:hypothetical protein
MKFFWAKRNWVRIVNPSLYVMLRYNGHSAAEALWNVIKCKLGGRAMYYPYRERCKMRRVRAGATN